MQINHGLANRAINRLSISSDGLHLYAASEGMGVFRLDLNNEPPPPIQDAPQEGEVPTASDETIQPTNPPPAEEEPATSAPEEEIPPIQQETTGSSPGLCGSIFGLIGLTIVVQSRRFIKARKK